MGAAVDESLFTLGLMIGISVSDLTVGTTIATLAWRSEIPTPLFEGDTVHCSTEVLGKRESNSRPGAGIVQFHHRALQPGWQTGRRVSPPGVHAHATEVADRRRAEAARCAVDPKQGSEPSVAV